MNNNKKYKFWEKIRKSFFQIRYGYDSIGRRALRNGSIYYSISNFVVPLQLLNLIEAISAFYNCPNLLELLYVCMNIMGIILVSVCLWSVNTIKELNYLYGQTYVTKMYMFFFIIAIIVEVTFFISFFIFLFQLSDICVFCRGVKIVAQPITGFLIEHIGLISVANILLIASSFSITSYFKLYERGIHSRSRLIYTFIFGSLFCLFQYNEYKTGLAYFTNNSSFSLLCLVGLIHWYHVMLGLLLILITIIRISLLKKYSSIEKYPELTMIKYYWHFVDLIWVGVIIMLYIYHVIDIPNNLFLFCIFMCDPDNPINPKNWSKWF